MVARQLANETLDNALLNKQHIVYVRSLALSDSLLFIKRVKLAGYCIDVHLLLCDIKVAISRVQTRELQIKRHLPTKTIKERHEMVYSLLPEIKNSADRFFTYENNINGLEPTLFTK